MERVFSRQRTVLDRFCLPVERLIYRIAAVDPSVEMTGKEYATRFVLFGLAGTLLLYAVLRTQHQPVLIKGNKQEFLAWIGKGVRAGKLTFHPRRDRSSGEVRHLRTSSVAMTQIG